jgi:sulfur carrier protein ThiS
MATITPNKGGIMEKGTYKANWGTVNSDGGGATYAADDYSLLEVLDSVDLQEMVQAVKVGGSLTPRHDYTQFTKKATLRTHLPYGGPLSASKVGLPVKFTRQTWNDLTVSAVALEGTLLSRRETGRNGDSVFEELEIDFNPHWAVEAL